MNPTKSQSDYGSAELAEAAETLPDAMLLQTALCYLITRYTQWPCSGLACTIVHRLQLLLAHPDLLSRTEERNIYGRLLEHWQNVATRPAATCASGVASRKEAPH